MITLRILLLLVIRIGRITVGDSFRNYIPLIFANKATCAFTHFQAIGFLLNLLKVSHRKSVKEKEDEDSKRITYIHDISCKQGCMLLYGRKVSSNRKRLVTVAEWLRRHPAISSLGVGHCLRRFESCL